MQDAVQGMGQVATAPELRRQQRMRTLACAADGSLVRLWGQLGLDPAFEALRGPETGLVALRGRIGGSGAPFNFGEATATRATVRLENGAVGHAMMLGRDRAAVTIAAVIDALAHDPALEARIEQEIIAPLQHERAGLDSQRRQETAATRVDFFTMVRGEDA